MTNLSLQITKDTKYVVHPEYPDKTYWTAEVRGIRMLVWHIHPALEDAIILALGEAARREGH